MRYINAIRNMPITNDIGRRLRYLIRDIVRELDEKRPDKDTRNRDDPTTDAADQELVRKQDGEAARGDIGRQQRPSAPAMPVYMALTPKPTTGINAGITLLSSVATQVPEITGQFRVF